MGNIAGTTADLRQALFETIQDLRDGKIEARVAKEVANVAEKIIKTGELDIRFTELCAELDKGDTGISPGPMVLGIERKA